MMDLRIDGLTKRYEGVTALDGATLEARPGERLVVLGPSGAGKTALARLISGLDAPDSGDILDGERSLLNVPPHERKVGLVPAGDSLWPDRTVSENVGYRLRLMGIGRRERRASVAEALGSARIEALWDRYPDALTAAQRWRVALARALVAGPNLLILDEPFGGLDARPRSELRDEVRRVQAEGRVTILILTSDPREALASADRLAVIDFGKVLQVGPPGEVYNRPSDGFVAQMLGPANLIQGQAEGLDGRGDLVVRTPLGRLIGRPSASGPIAPDSHVAIAIRPEAIGLNAPVPSDANRFAATVERLVMLGATRQVFLRAPGDWPITALALQATTCALREGQGLTAWVAPGFVVVFPSKSAGP